MTKEEAIHILRDSKPSISFGDHDDKVLERVANVCFAIDMAVEALKEHKVGKWINRIEHGYVACPVCGYLTACGGEDVIENLHYCFWCGTKMEGLEDDAMDGIWKCSKCAEFKHCSKEARVLGKMDGCEDFLLPWMKSIEE